MTRGNVINRILVLGIVFLLWIVPLGGSHLIDDEHYSGQRADQILWWYQLDAPSFGSSAVGDIDEDGFLEIVFGTYFNDEHIYALNGEDGSLLWSYDTGGCNDASPVIADVDLDGHLEVVIPASSPSMVYCFNGMTGAVEWSRSTGASNCIDSPPAVADVDNDDKPELLLGTFYGNVFCLNGEDGSIRWQKNLGSNSYIQSDPAILDVNEDGQLDVVVAQFAGDCRVYTLWGNNGSILWYLMFLLIICIMDVRLLILMRMADQSLSSAPMIVMSMCSTRRMAVSPGSTSHHIILVRRPRLVI